MVPRRKFYTCSGATDHVLSIYLPCTTPTCVRRTMATWSQGGQRLQCLHNKCMHAHLPTYLYLQNVVPGPTPWTWLKYAYPSVSYAMTVKARSICPVLWSSATSSGHVREPNCHQSCCQRAASLPLLPRDTLSNPRRSPVSFASFRILSPPS